MDFSGATLEQSKHSSQTFVFEDRGSVLVLLIAASCGAHRTTQ